MKRSLSLMGCGLLVVALASFGSGCSSKKKTTTTPDSGAGTGGGSGGTGGGSGGKGGSGGGGSSGKGDTGAGLTKAECMMMVATNSGNTTPAMCSDCLCGKDAAKTAACDGPCWMLAGCIGTMCGGDSMQAGCVSGTPNKCGSLLAAGAAKAMAVPFAMCVTECKVPPAMTDGGSTDAGN